MHGTTHIYMRKPQIGGTTYDVRTTYDWISALDQGC